jgi:hypothetical protein
MICRAVLFFFVLVALSACFWAKEYKRSTFTYSRNGQPTTIPLVVPKGYAKEETRDTAGVTLQTFYYPSGALMYAAYLTDTTFEIQPFDKSLHQPRIFPTGGLVYKGQDEKELFYREIRQGHLRFGYRLVPEGQELVFDSATNFAPLHDRSSRH